MPRALLSTGVRWGCSRPSTTMWPPGSGGCTPEMILIIVDLPDPLPPTRQWISPRARSKSTLDSAMTPPKRFEIPRSSRNIIACLPPRERAGRGPPATPLGLRRPSSLPHRDVGPTEQKGVGETVVDRLRNDKGSDKEGMPDV